MKHVSLTVTGDQVQRASNTNGFFIKVNGKDIVSDKIGLFRNALCGSESITFGKAFSSADIFPNLENTMDCEARTAAGGVDDFVLGSGIHHLYTHINDISRGKILSLFTLLSLTHQVFKGIIHNIEIVIEELDILQRSYANRKVGRGKQNFALICKDAFPFLFCIVKQPLNLFFQFVVSVACITELKICSWVICTNQLIIQFGEDQLKDFLKPALARTSSSISLIRERRDFF